VQIGLGLGLGLSLSVGASPSIQDILGSSLLGLWDAERIDKITLSGGTVVAWTDVVGNYSLGQGVGAARPAYSATSFNGRPGVTFDASDDCLTMASMPFPSGAVGSEIWALADQTALPADLATRTLMGCGGGVAATSRRCTRISTGGVNRAQAIVGDGVGGVFPNNTMVDLSGRHVMRAVFGPTATRMEVNGTAGAPLSAVPATGTARVTMGASEVSTPGAFWGGVISAVLITQPLSEAQEADLYSYFNLRKD